MKKIFWLIKRFVSNSIINADEDFILSNDDF